MGKNPIRIELSGMILVKDKQVKTLHKEPEKMLGHNKAMMRIS